MGIEVSVTGNMIGVSGYVTQFYGDNNLLIPAQYREKISYFNIQNMTENSLKIYSIGDDIKSASPISEIGSRMSISLKLSQRINQGVKIVFNNPNPNSNNINKTCEIVWTEISKNWCTSLAPSFSSVYSANTVSIVNTPHVAIDSLPNINVGNIPHVIIDNIPTVNIGTQDSDAFANDYVTTPMTSSQNNMTTSLTQSGVTAKSWYVSYINWRITGGAVGSADLVVQLKDGITVVYNSAIAKASPNGTSLTITFPLPIKITVGNSITYSISASGTVGTIVGANLGLFSK